MNTAKGTTPKPLQIKLQHECSNNNGIGDSFRVMYYGSAAAGSVPFMWESHPGTPKHALTESSLPPLTPPPSYYQFSQKYNSSMQLINHHRFSNSVCGFIRKSFLPAYRKRRPETAHTSSFSSSSSISSALLSWNLHLWQSRTVSKKEVRQEHAAGGSPVPAPARCLGGGFKKSYRISKLKKAIRWFVRHGNTK